MSPLGLHLIFCNLSGTTVNESHDTVDNHFILISSPFSSLYLLPLLPPLPFLLPFPPLPLLLPFPSLPPPPLPFSMILFYN